jgi:ATP-binding cassette subfamily G (WHITE) protein 2 (SNQ2)
MAFEFVRALRVLTDLAHNTTIAFISQAGESLWSIFNKVCLIYEGRMVYFGPISLARQYFIDMGYVPADRQTTADFLVSMTDPPGRRMITVENDNRSPDLKNQFIPQTALEFEEYYKNSEIRTIDLEDIRSYKAPNMDKHNRKVAYRESAKAKHAGHARRMVSKPIQLSLRYLIDFTVPIRFRF